jgi:hypothetical protein
MKEKSEFSMRPAKKKGVVGPPFAASRLGGFFQTEGSFGRFDFPSSLSRLFTPRSRRPASIERSAAVSKEEEA